MLIVFARFLSIRVLGKPSFKCFHSLQPVKDNNPIQNVLKVEAQKDYFLSACMSPAKGAVYPRGKLKI